MDRTAFDDDRLSDGYAVQDEERWVAEPPKRAGRTAFARDRARVLHSAALRRLAAKTQVLAAGESDFLRTRLTHSLECAQVGRELGAALGCDPDLVEVACLSHDLGHPPFGHAGEDELERQMEGFGGFDHNVQTFRVVTRLERRYPRFDGLNLTWETLEGIIKHNGPVTDKLDRPSWSAIAEFDAEYRLGLSTWASAEAQVAALADDIAYNNHDVDDGVQAGLFHLKELLDIPLIGPILHGVFKEYPDVDPAIIRLEAVRRMIGAMVEDVMAETRRRAEASHVQSAEDVRNLDHALVAFSRDMVEDLAQLRAFLMERMYRHWRVNRTRSQARRILAEMFQLFMSEPDVLPTEWFARSQKRDEAGRARVVCDYIAGMTDRFAIEEHRRLFHLDVWN